MTVENAHVVDLSDDIKEVLMLNLSEVDGTPVLHLAVSLREHRQYDPDLHGILLNGMPMRFLSPIPLSPALPVVEEEIEPDPTPEAPPAKKKNSAKATPATEASDTGADASAAAVTQEGAPADDAPQQ